MLESSVWVMQQREFWRSSLAAWKMTKGSPDSSDSQFFSLCMVPYFMWNTSAVQQWTLLSVEHRGVNLFTKQNPTCKPFLGAMVWTRALPLHLPWLRVLGCASGSSDWANKLLLIASWTAVQSTSECFLCWMLILKHYNHNLFWKCKWLHWPGPGFSAISCQVPSF